MNKINMENDLFQILKQQHFEILKILRTTDKFDFDKKVTALINSYDHIFLEYFEKITDTLITNFIYNNKVRFYCENRKIRRMNNKTGNTLSDAIKSTIFAENIFIRDVSYIQSTTTKEVIKIFAENFDEGIDAIIKALQTRGIFNRNRAYIITSNIFLALHSIGQIQKAKLLGASTKMWVTMDDNRVRDLHKLRHNKIAPIDGEIFGARFPGDPRLKPSDRRFCRCHLEFCE